MKSERDTILDTFGGRTGVFVDVGAFDGVRSSLTNQLREAGWHGVLVEPNPTNFLALRNNCPDCELVHAAVMPESGLVEFWQQPDGGELSSACKRHVDVFLHRHKTVFVKEYMAAVSPSDLLKSTCGAGVVSMLNIDAEGVSVDILHAFPVERMVNLELVAIEHDRRADECELFLANHGFAVALLNDLNLIMTRELP